MFEFFYSCYEQNECDMGSGSLGYYWQDVPIWRLRMWKLLLGM